MLINNNVKHNISLISLIKRHKCLNTVVRLFVREKNTIKIYYSDFYLKRSADLCQLIFSCEKKKTKKIVSVNEDANKSVLYL